MADGALGSLLNWGVRNSSNNESSAEANDTSAETITSKPMRSFNPDALAQLFGGPSDADRMREAIAAVQHPDIDLENKIIAFDNFEQLIENLDNANNMEPLGLWMPLVEQLENPEAELRRYAAWCVGTAVQNNTKSQERVRVFPSSSCFANFFPVLGRRRYPQIGEDGDDRDICCQPQKGCIRHFLRSEKLSACYGRPPSRAPRKLRGREDH